MHLGQIRPDGGVIAAVFEPDGTVRPIPAHTMTDLIQRSEAENVSLAEIARALASRHSEARPPILPIHPREVWACGCTYEQSASFPDAEHGTREGMYAYVYREKRPELFFKGTARVCVGPGQPIGMRADSNFTAAEPELAVVLGRSGRIVAYTIANDVSAWDIERENPLYLPQSKVFNACCALGPVMVTADEIADPYNLEITCTVERQDRTIFTGSVNTSRLHRKLDTLIDFLMRSNNVPAASVLLTGTGIILPEEAALAPGDTVRIAVPEIGELVNSVAAV